MSKALVSVIMPTYNHASFLKDSIGSVLGQAYATLELVIIDNFSQDNTEEIVRSYEDKRIRYFKFSNKGIIAASRNYGIQQARGKYVAFLDSDDIWENFKLGKQIEVISQDENIGLTYCSFKVQSPDPAVNHKILGPKKVYPANEIYSALLKKNFIVSSSVLAQKKALKHVGGFDENPKLCCAEDFDLWLRIVRQYQAIYVPIVGGAYRMHALNQSNDNSKLDRALAVIEKHRIQGWATQKLVEAAIASFYLQVGIASIGQCPKKARKYLLKAIQLKSAGHKLKFICFGAIILSYLPIIYLWIINNQWNRKIIRHAASSQCL